MFRRPFSPDGFGNRRADGYNIVLKTFHLGTRKMLVHPEAMGVAALADKIRKIENWPQKGILFHDITPVLQSAEYFRLLVDLLVYRYMGQKIDVVAGLDARGFIIGAALAYQLNVGFVPIRKRASCLLIRFRKATRWNTAKRRSKSTKTRSNPARACCWSMTWSQPAAPCSQAWN